jgi:very-short-patch-repair endonuclease
LLWSRLRNNQLDGIKFRRQQPIDQYIVDFISFETRLIIEIDGGQHNLVWKKEKDEKRTAYLIEQGYQVIRFWNNDVLENIDGVIIKIQELLDKRSHPHLASPIEGEGSVSCGKYCTLVPCACPSNF